VDVRLRGDRIAEVAPDLSPAAGELLLDAMGACLLPGLHDHHIHLMALAASLDSVNCGPPAIASEAQLARQLRSLNAEQAGTWLRGTGYHPCVAGDIDRHWLDRHIPDRPVRIQHRGGRLWVLNSAALDALLGAAGQPPAGMEMVTGEPTGRLYQEDAWLRQQLPRAIPDIGAASRYLASCGVTGVTDTTPTNGEDEMTLFARLQQEGTLLQRLRMMGTANLPACPESPLLQRGELKIHLLESDLPDWDATVSEVEAAHQQGRGVAIHCVTRTELVFSLGILEQAGAIAGDRIEHASVCPPELIQPVSALGLRVVTQPHFLAERGDQYLADVEPSDLPWLYRAAVFLKAGVPLAAGSDAPFGSADPWRSMRAAVQRQTPSGEVLGWAETLTPEQALDLFLSPPAQPGVGRRSVSAGAPADLCLMNAPWETLRNDLCRERVRATWIAGKAVFRSG
jgi:predicted amidohydrolase YtcJ